MKLKIRFAGETRFDVPARQLVRIRSWTQLLFGTRHSFHSLAMAEQPKPFKRHAD
jgi:hypothetical protein